ncbi:MAG: cytochrome C biosynthesis protein, partial [Dysgonamonadaceae bacterium]|nr:cytochrome C biosynthesis protein [Dysgonamonadaceae bacterium]
MNNKIIITFFLCLLICGCTPSVDSYTFLEENAKIRPEYEGTYIPYNIAPLNFEILEEADQFLVRLAVEGKDSFEIKTKDNVIIPIKKWKNLLENNKGEELIIKIFSKKNGKWTKYNDQIYSIAQDAVDPYIAYRLIEPGYNAWQYMGLYQQCIENYKESPILENSLTDKNCMNCHTFHKNNPEMMVFHLRGAGGGTMLSKDGEVKKYNTKAPWMMAAGVYPRWHPNGRYIAFSTNNTRQIFYTLQKNKIEVFDFDSDLVIFDTEREKIFTDSVIHSK